MAVKNIEVDHDAAMAQYQLQVERLRYEADRAERRYRAVESENRLVARTLVSQWERYLNQLSGFAPNRIAPCPAQHEKKHLPRQAPFLYETITTLDA